MVLPAGARRRHDAAPLPRPGPRLEQISHDLAALLSADPAALVPISRGLGEQVCVKQIVDFNEALCDYYASHCQAAVQCPPHTKADASKGSCADYSDNCLSWARGGECTRNPGFMLGECRQSCGACTEYKVRPGAPET